jgi:chromatin structure-remodeling complex subunit RSC9
MAPPPRNIREPSIPDTTEYTEFIQKLAAYHEKRGTHFEPEPRVGSKHVDLLHLFKTVVERGGYDKVSEEKLAWRKLGQDFNLGTNNLPALAFSLKTTYYKNLAAYEISTIHGKEPPPKEILEDTTAKGGGLLTRTLENYRPSARRETGQLGNDHSEASGDDGTPVRERNGSEETPGSGGRVTRGLRQAPPQRILFQPETHSSRQTRNASATSHGVSPQHHPNHQQQHQQPRGASTSYNPSSNMEHMSLAVANYEPRPQMPLTLRPVITPGNNPTEFARRQKALKDAAAAISGRAPAPVKGGVMLPGSEFTIPPSFRFTDLCTGGFDGPNIYVRCLCALRSGIPAEQDYALHHLVKISMERGDKYRFEGFPGLAEALIEKVLEVSSLFYRVDWQIFYMEESGTTSIDIINGLDGTSDLLQKISSLPKLDVDDNIQTAEFSDALLQINEAALTLRNMVMLEENAHYVSEMLPLRDFLSIALNLPNLDCVVELKHYALDIAEQITKYLRFDETHPLYISLLAQLGDNDRGAILTALRAISRISMNLEENNLLKGVPTTAIQNIIDWTLLNDEDLVHACLDFLYQYTAVVDNVDFLISELQVEPLINQLVRLLMHNAKIIEKELILGREIRISAPAEIAPLPKELFAQLIKLDEPERSSQWLRSLFEEDRDESITQIALWQAYQACFTPTVAETNVQLLPAAEFIKNVSTTFQDKAAAQVQAGPVQKFIIKGIRRRSIPVDMKGEEYSKCLWRSPKGEPCGKFFMSPESMYQHILKDHLSATQSEDGKFDNTRDQEYTCYWDRCHRFKTAPATKLLQIARHIKVHLPPRPSATKDSPDYFGPPPAKKLKPSFIKSPPRQAYKYQLTAMDERQDAAGIPLSAVLVLRNLARNLSKTEAEETALKLEGGVSWVDKLFKPVEPRLFEVMAHNKSLVSLPLAIHLPIALTSK